MSLQDFIKDTTREISDAVKLIEDRRTSLISQRKAAEERIKRTGTVITEQHKIQNERKKELHEYDIGLTEINKQIDEIEGKKRLLFEQLEEFKRKSDETKSSLAQNEQESNDAQKDIWSEKKIIEQFDRQIEEITNERNRYDKRIRVAYDLAFKLFLRNANSIINQYFTQAISRRAIAEAAENLRKKRHEEKRVSDLCDARDEWRRILKTASVPEVKEAGERELKRIEAEIDKMFPGALSFGSSIFQTNPATEIYYHEDEEETIIFLPFLEEQWKSMENGSVNYGVEVFGRFIEWITRESKLSYNDSYLRFKNDMVQLISRSGLGNLKNKNDIAFSVVGKDNLPFIVSPIPDEVFKSLSYEDAI